ncbi:MAG: ABC transporter ATP-binding protein [Opitutae bacterium]|nr:ABC transporter ATP-binding protein [Opitutae bacterium]
MSESLVITAESVAKTYRLWPEPAARLKRPLLAGAARLFPAGSGTRAKLEASAAACFRDFRALEPLTFQVRRGEALGIIGRNGSGKSTLLQLIAGILQPSHGAIATHGRISALLELGSGFNPDFTGRENVYLNGAILGLSHADMERLFPSIAQFADIGDFIDEPVKTYSSGMMMRLAFAVAVSVQPDVLIVDEALSVGDVFFTQKCFDRIREILAAGATLIFVSHDMAAVQNLCSRCLLLHNGRLIHDGAPEECVARYFSLHRGAASEHAVAGTHQTVNTAARSAALAHDLLAGAKSRIGDREFEFVAGAVFDAHGTPATEFELQQQARIHLLLRAKTAVRRPSVGLQVHDRMNNLVFAAGTPQLRFDLPALAAGQEILLEFRLTWSVQPGVYTLSFDAAEFDADNPNVGHFHDRVGGVGPFTISHHAPGALPFYGIAKLPMEISYA